VHASPFGRQTGTLHHLTRTLNPLNWYGARRGSTDRIAICGLTCVTNAEPSPAIDGCLQLVLTQKDGQERGRRNGPDAWGLLVAGAIATRIVPRGAGAAAGGGLLVRRIGLSSTVSRGEGPHSCPVLRIGAAQWPGAEDGACPLIAL
jgi:hypothetical protein